MGNQSEVVIRRTDNTMVNREGTKSDGQTIPWLTGKEQKATDRQYQG